MMMSKDRSFTKAVSRSEDKLELSGLKKSSTAGINPNAYSSGRKVVHPEVCTEYKLINGSVSTVRYFSAFIHFNCYSGKSDLSKPGTILSAFL